MRLIDADYLKQALSSNCKPELCPDYENAWCNTCCPHNDFENIIDAVPTVKITEEQAIDKLYETGWIIRHDKEMTERPQGKWIIEHDWVHCSSCGHEQNYPSKFCPNCGADMRGGVE